jgi:hypothetical protein
MRLALVALASASIAASPEAEQRAKKAEGSCGADGGCGCPSAASPLAREAFATYNRTLRPRVPAVAVAAYATDGVITLRGLLPAALAVAAHEEVEEVWRHYLLPAGFVGTAFLRNARVGAAAQELAGQQLPFDRLYNLEQLSPALRRLVTLQPVADAVARAMNVSAVRPT